jgi:DNA-binding transcriptional LysR family regulator
MFRSLALLDQGIMLLPEAVIGADLAAGRLVRVLPEWHSAPVPVYALTETRLLPAKTQRFIDFLQERFRHVLTTSAVGA